MTDTATEAPSWTQHYAYPPIPKGRPRKGRNGSFYTPKSTLDFEDRSRTWWQGPRFDGPVAATIVLGQYGFDVTVTEIVDAGVYKLRGDIDNYVKAILDGLQDKRHARTGLIMPGAFDNDSQVKQLSVTMLTEGQHPKAMV